VVLAGGLAVDVLAGVELVVVELELELAAFARAAPPPASAAVAATVTIRGLIRCEMSVTSLDLTASSIPTGCQKDVRER
jgi:hypothetical protein